MAARSPRGSGRPPSRRPTAARGGRRVPRTPATSASKPAACSCQSATSSLYSPVLSPHSWSADARFPAAPPTRLHVSGVETLADASLSYGSIQQWDAAGRLDGLLSLTRQVWRTRAYGDMWSYMLLAEGHLDIAGEFDLQPYDMAALVPIVQEAGGRFSSADGADGPWHGSALATNGRLHQLALDAIARPVR